jgi:hypothetical protein
LSKKTSDDRWDLLGEESHDNANHGVRYGLCRFANFFRISLGCKIGKSGERNHNDGNADEYPKNDIENIAKHYLESGGGCDDWRLRLRVSDVHAP